MDAVRVERGTPLRGAALTPAQKEQLYREGFVILQDALPSSLTTACKRRITQPTAAEAEADTVDKEGSAPWLVAAELAARRRCWLASTILPSPAFSPT
jgi:hypothetical protein